MAATTCESFGVILLAIDDDPELLLVIELVPVRRGEAYKIVEIKYLSNWIPSFQKNGDSCKSNIYARNRRNNSNIDNIIVWIITKYKIETGFCVWSNVKGQVVDSPAPILWCARLG
ncbi:hypothetical protein DERF_012904 [Dermatophagoides farinae]|uniref:Uncharacterized protein n=1 Tax=Dermatophagoides farinae TaxID=6954 RepID=A0A922HQG1_DERFA|nr:hypothetical protein DERF_012904 [Dermatophagoides farinae]